MKIEPSKLQTSLKIPPSKSHTLRAILFASFAKGVSSVENFLNSPDTDAMILALTKMGARISRLGTLLEIEGFDGKPQTPDDVIDCGNSGQVLRFVGAIAALCPGYTVFTGDASIRLNRPAMPLLDGLNQLGATAISSKGNGHAPLIIKGPITNNFAEIDGEDSQPVSGLLIAAAFAPHPIQLKVKNPGEKPWVHLTLDWFSWLGIPYKTLNFTEYFMEGCAKLDPFDYTVPGDFSACAFPIVAALITNSELEIQGVDMQDVQGDKAVIPVLEKMGAKFTIAGKTLFVHKGSSLKGMKIDVNDFIDALPILAVAGCFAEGKTEIVNGAIARKKESDRIASIVSELKKMGAKIEETPDGVIVEASSLRGAEVNSFSDHRIALSLAVAALGAKGQTTIQGAECINKSYPTFCKDLM